MTEGITTEELKDIMTMLKTLTSPTTPPGERRVSTMDETRSIVRDLAVTVKEIASNQSQLQADFREMTRNQQELITRLVKMETRAEMGSGERDLAWKYIGIIMAVLLVLIGIFRDAILRKP